MKKLIVGALVGGLIMFICQTLSWAMLNLHHASQEYTPKQDSIMAYLNTQFSEDGSYLMPNYPKNTSREEMEKSMDANKGKPWAQIQFHKSLDTNMGANILKGFIVDIIILAFMCWILMKIFTIIFQHCFSWHVYFTGIIVFFKFTIYNSYLVSQSRYLGAFA